MTREEMYEELERSIEKRRHPETETQEKGTGKNIRNHLSRGAGKGKELLGHISKKIAPAIKKAGRGVKKALEPHAEKARKALKKTHRKTFYFLHRAGFVRTKKEKEAERKRHEKIRKQRELEQNRRIKEEQKQTAETLKKEEAERKKRQRIAIIEEHQKIKIAEELSKKRAEKRKRITGKIVSAAGRMHGHMKKASAHAAKHVKKAVKHAKRLHKGAYNQLLSAHKKIKEHHKRAKRFFYEKGIFKTEEEREKQRIRKEKQAKSKEARLLKLKKEREEAHRKLLEEEKRKFEKKLGEEKKKREEYERKSKEQAEQAKKQREKQLKSIVIGARSLLNSLKAKHNRIARKIPISIRSIRLYGKTHAKIAHKAVLKTLHDIGLRKTAAEKEAGRRKKEEEARLKEEKRLKEMEVKEAEEEKKQRELEAKRMKEEEIEVIEPKKAGKEEGKIPKAEIGKHLKTAARKALEHSKKLDRYMYNRIERYHNKAKRFLHEKGILKTDAERQKLAKEKEARKKAEEAIKQKEERRKLEEERRREEVRKKIKEQKLREKEEEERRREEERKAREEEERALKEQRIKDKELEAKRKEEEERRREEERKAREEEERALKEQRIKDKELEAKRKEEEEKKAEEEKKQREADERKRMFREQKEKEMQRKEEEEEEKRIEQQRITEKEKARAERQKKFKEFKSSLMGAGEGISSLFKKMKADMAKRNELKEKEKAERERIKELKKKEKELEKEKKTKEEKAVSGKELALKKRVDEQKKKEKELLERLEKEKKELEEIEMKKGKAVEISKEQIEKAAFTNQIKKKRSYLDKLETGELKELVDKMGLEVRKFPPPFRSTYVESLMELSLDDIKACITEIHKREEAAAPAKPAAREVEIIGREIEKLRGHAKEIKKVKAAKKISAKLIKTGIKGFDSLVKKGVPKGSTIVISGASGTGKTIFCLQALYEAVKRGDKCLYISLEERPEKLLHYMKTFGWNAQKYVDQGTLVIQRLNPINISTSIEALLAKARGELLIEANPMLIPEGFEPDWIVIDSLGAFSSAFGKAEEDYRVYVEQLFKYLEGLKCTTFLISETEEIPKIGMTRGRIEDFLADAIVIFYHIRRGNIRQRAIEILKMRGVEHEEKVVAMQIVDKQGMVVYPEQEVFGGLE